MNEHRTTPRKPTEAPRRELPDRAHRGQRQMGDERRQDFAPGPGQFQ